MLYVCSVALTAYPYLEPYLNPFYKPSPKDGSLSEMEQSVNRILKNNERYATKECQDALRHMEKDTARGDFDSNSIDLAKKYCG